MFNHKRLATFASTTLLFIGLAPTIALPANAKEFDGLNAIQSSELTTAEDGSAQSLGGVVIADCQRLENPLICFVRGGGGNVDPEPEAEIPHDSSELANSSNAEAISIFEIRF